MRFVVYGAGAIGGAIGAKLHQAGQEVVLIARGAQLHAVQAKGLTLQTPKASNGSRCRPSAPRGRSGSQPRTSCCWL